MKASITTFFAVPRLSHLLSVLQVPLGMAEGTEPLPQGSAVAAAAAPALVDRDALAQLLLLLQGVAAGVDHVLHLRSCYEGEEQDYLTQERHLTVQF